MVRTTMGTPTQKLEGICAEIYSRWDADQRPGKLLSALAGGIPEYRQDVTDVRAALAENERLTAERDALLGDGRWAVNVLLETIAAKFEALDTWDIWRSDAASLVRGFKHPLGANEQLEP